jgi:hypothetical protein
MADTWNEEEYYDDPYYEDYYPESPPRTWSTLALVASGCFALLIGFSCAACALLTLGALFLLPVSSSTSPAAAGDSPAAVVETKTAQEWVQVLESAGLEVENSQVLSGADGGLPPGSASGVRFDIPSYCGPCGGKVIVFDSPEYVAPTVKWLRELGEYAYGRGPVLLEIDGSVPEDIALEYQAALMRD